MNNTAEHKEGIELMDRIIVALDFPDLDVARNIVKQLTGTATYLKVGMELYYQSGPSFIHELKELGFKVFVDLKLHDIPNTVKGAAKSLTKLGVDMFNVHATGAVEMMMAAREGLEQALAQGQTRPLLIGVTMLTSTDQRIMNEEMGIPGSVEDRVQFLASQTKKAGLDGVVASPLEVPTIKSVCGKSFITVTPGIRPIDAAVHDQKRITTPEQAIALGTDYMVIGRSITQAEHPAQAFYRILQSIVTEGQVFCPTTK